LRDVTFSCRIALASGAIVLAGLPWVAAGSAPANITGVTAFRYSGNSLTLFSADLGSTAKALYEKAEHETQHEKAQHENALHENALHASGRS
jgi:hypothetical protein